jgi:outer membrane lipoprotein-sorting protein
MSQMGMDLILNIYYKTPNKSKTVISFNGQEIIQVFDGEKGYMINPMMGSTEPQELPVEQAESMKKQSQFKSPLSGYFAEGKLTLEGNENVKDKPAFKIKVNDPANTIYMFIDKATYMPVKTTATTGGVNVDTFMEWGEISGIMLPKVTTISAQGMEMVMYIESAEVNIPLEDSFFKVK